MLLRPATPLAVLLLAAFGLLLVSVISTPIIKGIPLATFENVDYGVFGYCKGSTCTGIHVGYTNSDLSNFGSDTFNLPSSTRMSLSSILVVHPVAAFLTLVCFGMAAAAHFHAPSHSPRFLLALLILLLPTLLVSLLAFLVDVLLFVPHMQWGSWIVLAATILIVTCGVLTCAMRRTLVSRKARKRRIAENAEMSGENYYNRQNAAAAAAGLAPSSPPPSNYKEPILTESAPTFASFRTGASDDEQMPLNRSMSPLHDSTPTLPSISDHGYNPQRRGDEQLPMDGPRDAAGNAMLPRGPYGPGPGRGGPPGFGPRGRGRYPQRGGYGRGGPYGGPRRPPPNGRGGYMGPMRGGPPGGPMGRGPRGPPMGMGYGPGPGGPGYGPPPPGSMRPPSFGPAEMEAPYDGADGSIGQAIEMQPQRHVPDDEPAYLGPHALTVDHAQQQLASPTSVYSSQEPYVAPRSGWTPGNAEPPSGGEPRRTSGSAYYEDVDPRFADSQEAIHPGGAHVPSALMPGPVGEPQFTESLESLPPGARSPAASETSHFTSISERPVNPQWHPPPLPVHQQQPRTNVLLENNPDFELVSNFPRGPGRGRGRGGLVGTGSRIPPVPATRGPSPYPSR